MEEKSNFASDMKVVREAIRQLPCICGALTESGIHHSDCLQHNAIHALRRIEKRMAHEIDRRLRNKERPTTLFIRPDGGR